MKSANLEKFESQKLEFSQKRILFFLERTTRAKDIKFCQFVPPNII